MALNPSIILAGQAPDIMGATRAGMETAAMQNQMNQQNALAALYREQGPGIMSGNQESLNALAQFDPNAALGVQGSLLGMQAQKQQMAFSAEEMQMRREEGKRRAAEALATNAATLTAEQLAAEQEQITKGLSGAAFFYQNQDRAGYDSFLAQNGMDPAEFPFDQFPAHAAMFEGALEAMQTFAPPAPAGPLSAEGKVAADVKTGWLPEGTAKAPGTVVNVGAEGDKFYEELDKKAAAMFDTLQTDGIQAGRTLGLIDRLDQLTQSTPTGAGAVLTRMAGELGIDVGGVGDVQAVQALINQIVPQQRQPGSGPMSDADLALFKQSVPRLINTPEGNAKIIETMRGINNYVLQQSQIANDVANRAITPAEGRKMLQGLANPLEGFSTNSAGNQATTPPQTGASPLVIDGFTIEAIE